MTLYLRLCLLAVCVLATSACGDDSSTPTSPTSEVGVGTLWVTIDGSCFGDTASVAVFVNGAFRGSTEPDGDGVVVILPTGAYQVQVVATPRPGRPRVSWAPATVTVERSFQQQGFRCT